MHRFIWNPSSSPGVAMRNTCVVPAVRILGLNLHQWHHRRCGPLRHNLYGRTSTRSQRAAPPTQLSPRLGLWPRGRQLDAVAIVGQARNRYRHVALDGHLAEQALDGRRIRRRYVAERGQIRRHVRKIPHRLRIPQGHQGHGLVGGFERFHGPQAARPPVPPIPGPRSRRRTRPPRNSRKRSTAQASATSLPRHLGSIGRQRRLRRPARTSCGKTSPLPS